jgi:allophanate hydrolase subunit 2
MRDAQTSGGYPKIATIIAADLWRIGQTGLGGRLRFEQTSYPDALAAQDEVSACLDKLRANVRCLGEFKKCR